jgi:alanine racemase
VKADAYGHGAKELAEFAYEKHNIKHFAVATFDEAIELRNIMPDDTNIIIFGHVNPYYVKEAVKNNIILTVYNEEIARLYSEYTSDEEILKIVLKIDTGMNRIGFKPNLNIQEFLACFKNFEIFCIMSHLSSADADENYTLFQIGIFDKCINSLRINLSTSLFNSAAICKFKNKYTFTRPGIMTYGYVNTKLQTELKKVMYLFTSIIHVNNVKKGDRIGYNGTFIAPSDMRIGVLPIGYGDGLRRNLSNKGFVFIDDIKCNIIGNICMDMTIVDISSLPENSLSHDVEILGEHIDANELAEICNTIPYEILTNFSSRVKRYYIK